MPESHPAVKCVCFINRLDQTTSWSNGPMTNVRNILIIIAGILVTGATFFSFGLLVGSYSGFQIANHAGLAEETKDAEAEYYRGVYDVCFQQIRRFDVCLKTVRKMNEANWYEKPSSGWEWPLTIDEPVAQTNPLPGIPLFER
jgi:hypothetical protein